MIYILLDAALLLIAAFVSVKYIRNPFLGLLFLSSCVFIAHSAVNLIYGINGQPNASIVYQSVPSLQTAHKALSLIIAIYIFIYFIRLLPTIEWSKLTMFLGPILLSIALLTFSLIFFSRPHYDVYYQDIIGQFLFLNLLATLYCMRATIVTTDIARGYLCFLAICVISVCVGVFEIVLLRVQAATNYEQLGENYRLIVAYRASGIFMNPNWAANWAAFFAAASIVVYQYGLVRGAALLGIACSVIIIFLSGSRGGMATAIVICLILLAPGPFVSIRSSLIVAFVAMGTFLAMNMAAYLADWISPEGPISTRLYGLFFRWVLETQRLVVYAFQLVLSKLTGSAPPIAIPSSAAEQSIFGRLDGTGADNGFLSFYSSGGIIGIATIAIVFAVCGAAINRTVVMSRRDPQFKRLVPIAIAGTLSIAILAMQLRAFSVYPIWIFAATILAAVLSIPAVAQRKHQSTN